MAKNRENSGKVSSTWQRIKSLQPVLVEQVEGFARQGCTPNEVAAAFGFTEAQKAEMLGDEEHPLAQAYWAARHDYMIRLRGIAMDIAESSSDASVRAKMVEFLVRESQEMLINKASETGIMKIKSLLSLVRQQYESDAKKCETSCLVTIAGKRADARNQSTKTIKKAVKAKGGAKSGKKRT